MSRLLFSLNFFDSMTETDHWLKNFFLITRFSSENFCSCMQILVCTSTLAWGVNLPAHLVIIKVQICFGFLNW
ncbi:hypothetical protein BHM03_00038714 [Ensete ventricosum]|nr:hypothetical protein BHM03_00038714 [Ensete ventricosum]